MYTKTGYRIPLVITMLTVFVATTASFAASSLVSGGTQGGGDEALERELEGGIRITLEKVFRSAEDAIAVSFIVESQEDTFIEGYPQEIFDNKGNRFERHEYWSWIGNEACCKREIIGGVKTQILHQYYVPPKYDLPLFARMTFKFNGKDLVFRNLQTQNKETKKE